MILCLFEWWWWQILRSPKISGKKVLTGVGMPSDDWFYSWASGAGEDLIAAGRCLIGWLLSTLAFLLSSVHSGVLEPLSCALGGWPPFDPVWCERLPVFVVNTSLYQLSLQLVLVGPAWSTSVTQAFAEFAKELSFGHPGVVHARDIAGPAWCSSIASMLGSLALSRTSSFVT